MWFDWCSNGVFTWKWEEKRRKKNPILIDLFDLYSVHGLLLLLQLNNSQNQIDVSFVVWFCFNELHLYNASYRLGCKSMVVTRLHCIIVTAYSIRDFFILLSSTLSTMCSICVWISTSMQLKCHIARRYNLFF